MADTEASMRRYLARWAVLTLVAVLAVAAINVGIDPYGLFRLADIPRLNTVKPEAGVQEQANKAYQVLRVNPRAIVLGNSRAEVGFNPESHAWPGAAEPVYNIGLPGTGTAVSLRYLQHVIAHAEQGGHMPKVVVWGIDYMDFLADVSTPARARQANAASRLLTAADGSPNRERLLAQVQDVGEAAFTLTALMDSVDTIKAQGDRYAPDLTALGFNPMHDYVKITAEEGAWAVFRQRDIENLKIYLRRPKHIYYDDDSGGRSSHRLDNMREILRLCHSHGIALYLAIYPYHARLLETLRVTGHWDVFEEWKRTVVQLLDEDSQQYGSGFPLWDFSGFNAYTTETVPAASDKRATMRWYWEAGHFKQDLGDFMLERMFGDPGAPLDFGVRLDAGNVEERITLTRQRELDYRGSHATEVAELERLAAAQGSAR